MINLINTIAQINESDIPSVPKNTLTSEGFVRIAQTISGMFAVVAVLIISLAALKLVMSRGNPQEVAKAREAIIYAAVGLVISMAAFIIVSFVVGSV